nr:MAG TPA: hypothetical protein [Caudoviricetes sp.]
MLPLFPPNTPSQRRKYHRIRCISHKQPKSGLC